MNKKPKTIAVYGSSGITQDSEGAQQAYRLGALLAQAGYQVITGGYMGVMEACSRGAQEAGGTTIGVLCRDFSDRVPNPYLTEHVWTEDLPERITTLMKMADAYIVLDGSIGTLAELLLAWNLKVMGGTKPIIVVGERLRNMVIALKESTEVRDQLIDLLDFVPDADSAVEWLNSEYA